MNNNQNRYYADYFLIVILVFLAVISIFTLYTIQPALPPDISNTKFYVRQALWFIIGGVFIGMMMILDYDWYRKLSWYLYGIGVLLLLGLALNIPASLVLTLNHSTSWYSIPHVGTIQPGEFMKVFLIITLGHVITSHHEKRKTPQVRDDLWLLIKILIIALPPVGLVVIQPDLGTALVYLSITAVLILISGIRWRILFAVAGIILVVTGAALGLFYLFPGIIKQLEDSIFSHALERFYGWLAPEQHADSYGMQLIQAMLSIGSGQLFGKGMMNLEVYIPERHTDMIFTAIAEQFGFIGGSVVVMVFFLLIYRIIHISLACKDPFGSYLGAGTAGMITYQIVQNIGMSIQLLPITGLPLPFISYGGSSLIAYFMAMGLVMNVRSRHKVFMFDTKNE
ncbi:cell division protein FtsW (lipid II flippase) [Melghiribacillus thermohalophilus]|uniref:Cell division protein FtsW (Lipid II flippase) n=1 Tax=Melghiribacillus thermohalophilus TaxID=1324956 RepID=A0A4R3N6D3_9BACI|nr:FtsW/RodA/SpoVE family cell cycle protein [Melghiribacillus thermohalophilus]TCT22399.1 cell division protein FtsW (lipid II flippase) [Melghiribacillus thermohalophilus]